MNTDAIMTGFSNALAFLQAWLPVLDAISWLTGLGLIMWIGYRLAFSHNPDSRSGRAGPISLGQVALGLLFAAMFLRLPSVISENNAVLLGGQTDYRAALAAAPKYSGGSAFWTLVLQVLIMWVVVIGATAVYRGFLLWQSAANGGGSRSGGDLFWQGLWHIIFGSIAVSIGTFLV